MGVGQEKRAKELDAQVEHMPLRGECIKRFTSGGVLFVFGTEAEAVEFGRARLEPGKK